MEVETLIPSNGLSLRKSRALRMVVFPEAFGPTITVVFEEKSILFFLIFMANILFHPFDHE